MIYRVILSNYKSFADEVQFDMFPNLKRENFGNHVYQNGPIPVLKQCAIYGANGAGKSNFVHALTFLQNWITDNNANHNAEWLHNWYLKNRFRLPALDESIPVSIFVEFSIRQNVFMYNVEIDGDGVKNEVLLKSGMGKGENVSILERNRKDVQFKATLIGEDVRQIFVRQIESNPAASILGINGLLHIVEDKNIDDAYLWFRSTLNIIQINHQIPWLISKLKEQPKLMEFINSIFKEIDLGIQNMTIHNELFDNWIERAEKEDKDLLNRILENTKVSAISSSLSKMREGIPELDISEENGKRMVHEFIFTQLGQNGYTGNMEIEAQSTGTVKLLTLIPAIYDAIHNDSTVIIDEIDNGIHPMLIKKLVGFFGKSHSSGQLIYTTHETALLNQQELLRPDEVWLTEKYQGATKMYSLNEFKIHKTLSLENGYLEGRFGAIPFIGTL